MPRAVLSEGARHWDTKAARLKRAFNEAFWLPGQGWYAVALDRDKRPVDALTSNIGHGLWTGIADADKAAAVADHLLSDEMFSGWGIRTLAVSMAAYNPMSYHNGSVWPHDDALCAAGLMLRFHCPGPPGRRGHLQRRRPLRPPPARAVLRVPASLTIDVRDDGWRLAGLEDTGVELIRQPRHHHPPTRT